MVLNFDNKKVADIPIPALADEAPQYDREWKKFKVKKNNLNFKVFKKIMIEEALTKIL